MIPYGSIQLLSEQLWQLWLTPQIIRRTAFVRYKWTRADISSQEDPLTQITRRHNNNKNI